MDVNMNERIYVVMLVIFFYFRQRHFLLIYKNPWLIIGCAYTTLIIIMKNVIKTLYK